MMSEDNNSVLGAEAAPTVAPTATTEAIPAATTTEPASFNSQLSEDLRSESSLQDFKDINGLAKSYVHLNKQQGSSIRVPGEDAGAEDMQAFYEKVSNVKGLMRRPDADDKAAMDAFYTQLGRPETAEGYSSSIKEGDVPKGSSFDENMMGQFKDTAHKLGLTKVQAEGIMEFELGRYDAATQQQSMQLEEARTLLQSQWGNEYSNKQTGVATVKRHYEGTHPDHMRQLEEVAGTNPVLAMIMADAGTALVEKGHVVSGIAYAGETPDEAKEKIAEIRNNKEHPWHKGDSSAVAKMRKLYQAAYPGQG